MTGKHFTRYLQIYISQDMRNKLAAVSYFIGQKGMFSKSAKKFILEGLQRFEEGLTPAEMKKYKEILYYVETEEAMGGDRLKGGREQVTLDPQLEKAPE